LPEVCPALTRKLATSLSAALVLPDDSAFERFETSSCSGESLLALSVEDEAEAVDSFFRSAFNWFRADFASLRLPEASALRSTARSCVSAETEVESLLSVLAAAVLLLAAAAVVAVVAVLELFKSCKTLSSCDVEIAEIDIRLRRMPRRKPCT